MRRSVFPSEQAGLSQTGDGQYFLARSNLGALAVFENAAGAALVRSHLSEAPEESAMPAPALTLERFSQLATVPVLDDPSQGQVRVRPGQIIEVTGIGRYRVLSGGDRTRHLPRETAQVPLEVLPVDGVHDLRAFGAVADYDPSVEEPGMLARNATDNFPAFLAAARAFEKHLRKGVLSVSGGGIYWASNMPRFRVSDFTFWIADDTTILTTVPTSFGTTLYVGETGKTRNVKVLGGGAVRNHLPDASRHPRWEAGKRFEPGTYVRNARGHLYWTREGGVAGPREPKAVSRPQTDGGVVWRDALNDNGISVLGDDIQVIGMRIPEASNKALTCQAPPWTNVWFERNVVGRTGHDGIELKGNQAIAGQADLFGQRGAIIGNIVEDAGRHGIHVQQPASGSKRNRNIVVRDNIVRKNGYRHRTAGCAGIRINRCTGLALSGNRVLDSYGNGVHLRLCQDASGDIDVEQYGTFGLHLQECEDFRFDRVELRGGSADHPAIREAGAKGTNTYGNLTVAGGRYTFALEVVDRRGRVSVDRATLDRGIRGTVKGAALQVR